MMGKILLVREILETSLWFYNSSTVQPDAFVRARNKQFPKFLEALLHKRLYILDSLAPQSPPNAVSIWSFA